MVNYIHDLPGRLRVKSAAIKRNPREAERIRSAVAAMQGVMSVDVNLRTGSVTIDYLYGATSSHRILGFFQLMGFGMPAAHGRPRQVLAQAGERFAKAAAGAVIDRLVERSAVALIAALL